MAITLHFDHSVDPQEAQRRLQSGAKLHHNPHLADRIGRYTGIQVGNFSIQLTEELLLDLLDYGDDAVALHQWTDILLIQRDGKLTLNSQSHHQEFRERLLRRRPAQIEPLGYLDALD